MGAASWLEAAEAELQDHGMIGSKTEWPDFGELAGTTKGKAKAGDLGDDEDAEEGEDGEGKRKGKKRGRKGQKGKKGFQDAASPIQKLLQLILCHLGPPAQPVDLPPQTRMLH